MQVSLCFILRALKTRAARRVFCVVQFCALFGVEQNAERGKDSSSGRQLRGSGAALRRGVARVRTKTAIGSRPKLRGGFVYALKPANCYFVPQANYQAQRSTTNGASLLVWLKFLFFFLLIRSTTVYFVLSIRFVTIRIDLIQVESIQDKDRWFDGRSLTLPLDLSCARASN